MSPKSAAFAPQAAIKAAARECVVRLKQQSFAGDVDGMRETFSEYQRQNADMDPYGRWVGEEALDGSTSLLAFRSTTTCPTDLHQNLQLRWSAWLSILPLDLQLNFLTSHCNREDFGMIDPFAFAWEQRAAVDVAHDQAEAFRKSPLGKGGARPSPGLVFATEKWSLVRRNIDRSSQQHALKLMAWKQWDQLETWMAASRLHACAAVSLADLPFRTPRSHGTVAVVFESPVPFWSLGVFVGASEPDFWEVMGRSGGPVHPCLREQDPPTPSPPLEAGQMLSGPPPDFNAPMEWLRSYDPFSGRADLFPNEMKILVARTAAQWRLEILKNHVGHGLAPAKPTRRM